MAEKNLVEEALIQIQNLEEAINENAKEILHSTMKEEISELVKESMKNEAEEEDEFEVEDEMESEDESEEEEDEFELEDESEEDESEEEEDEFGTEDDEDSEEMFDMLNLSDMSGDGDFDSMGIQDLSDESMDTVLKAFKEMKPTDTFEIKKDGDFIHLKDEEDEYLIQTESEEEEFEMDDFNEEVEVEEEEVEEIVYEIEMDEAEETDEMYSEMYSEENEEYMTESAQLVGMSKGFKSETKESTKAKGMGMGSPNKKIYSNKPNMEGGFKTVKKNANKTMGTGKPKFEFKEGDTFEMPSRTPKLSKEEAKEASRTYGMGWRDGALKKGARAGQNQARLYTESMVEELEMLKVKNEEYRKALNMFRDKLNEVAVFNSNLAYATRLFTEHSTSKQEKINVLRRFDSAETLKESKALYRTIKEELGGESKKFVTESIEKVIDKSPQSGSAVNLIESKTYENPQFLRMKDIMSKIIK
jgi:hypothetical protein